MVNPAPPPAADVSNLPILATKLAIPPSQAEIVNRSRLTGRLADGLTGKLTLVSAPPGSGKTTLVTEWIESAGKQRRDRVAWLGLDAGDNDPGRFLTYLVAAIRTVQPDFGQGLINLLQNPVTRDASIALVDLINALSVLPEQVVLVLDDFHVITHRDVHDIVSYLLSRQPPTIHLIITTRDTPPLPLSLLRSRREVVEFRPDELRFTVDEATAFLNGVMGLDLDDAQVLALEERTEGWIAGLLLAALSASDAADPSTVLDSFSGEHRYVFDYLAEEVISRQSADVQQFLEQTSILGRMSSSLVEALSGQGQEMLEFLVDANLFTMPMDSYRTWYRYHHLFGDFLSARFREGDPAGWQDAHRRAGAWFYANNHRFEAAEHALAAGDYESLGLLIEEVGPLLVRRGRISTIKRWLEAMPETCVLERPGLVLQHAWVAMFSRDLANAASWLEKVDLDNAHDPAQAAQLRLEDAVACATYSRFQGNVSRTIELSRIALDLFREGPGLDAPDACIPMLHLGSSLRISGETGQAVDVLRQSLALSGNGSDRIVELNSMSQLAATWWDLGEFSQSERQAREAIAFEQEHGLARLAMAGAAQTALADILRFRGELDTARNFSTSAFDVIVASGDGEDIAAQMWALHTTAMIDVGRGEFASAAEAIGEAVDRARRYLLNERLQWTVRGLRAHVQLMMGDVERAARWDPLAYAGFPVLHPYLDERASITGGWILIEQGRHAEATELLARLIASLEQSKRLPRLAEAKLMMVATLDIEGRSDAALNLGLEAARWALSERAWRVFVDGHPRVRELLPDLQQAAVSAGLSWPSHLDEPPADHAPARKFHQRLEEPLTERELEVLALLGAGITNRDIAEQIFVSVGTVKRHTHNIYGKLNVSNRTQAIVRGQELGLIAEIVAKNR